MYKRSRFHGDPQKYFSLSYTFRLNATPHVYGGALKLIYIVHLLILNFKDRLLYALFLKGAGMKVEDALAVILGEFAKTLDQATITKKRYAYEVLA